MTSSQLKTVQGTIPFKGYETWYERIGESEPGKAPLLTLHGGPGALHNYLKSLDGIAETGREVIYYDQLGCGLSPTPYLPDLWSPDLWMDEIDAVRESLGLDEVHILGQSWGGMLAMQYAIERRPAGVRSMVVASSPASLDLWASEALRLVNYLPDEHKQAILKGLDEGVYDSAEYLAASDVYYARHVCNLDPYPDFVAHSFSNMGDVYHVMQGYSEFMVVGKLTGWDITDRLGTITIPTLLTSGTDDEATAIIVKSIFDRIPDCRWELFYGTHLCHVEQAPLYNQVVEAFLAAHDGPGDE